MTVPTISAPDFVAAYAQRAGVSALDLLERGRVVATCSCGHALCEGWQLVPADTLGPGDEVTITLADYASLPTSVREADQRRCDACGRYVGLGECSKGCGGRQ